MLSGGGGGYGDADCNVVVVVVVAAAAAVTVGWWYCCGDCAKSMSMQAEGACTSDQGGRWKDWIPNWRLCRRCVFTFLLSSPFNLPERKSCCFQLLMC
jgi:hypothetical protein